MTTIKIQRFRREGSSRNYRAWLAEELHWIAACASKSIVMTMRSLRSNLIDHRYPPDQPELQLTLSLSLYFLKDHLGGKAMKTSIVGMRTVVVALALITAAGCAVNPVTGKNELSLYGEDWEMQVGEQYYAPLRQQQEATSSSIRNWSATFRKSRQRVGRALRSPAAV